MTNNAQIKPPRISIAVRAWNEAAVIRSALFKGDEHFSPTNPHIRFFTGKMLSQLTASAGFVQIETTTCGLNKPRRDLMVATHILLKARKR